MIGLDTPVLLGILTGQPVLRPRLKEWQRSELATTEWNLLELEALARREKGAGRERRLAALGRLRRCVTVLPIDARAIAAATPELALGRGSATDLIPAAMVGAVEAAGGEEWWTVAGFAPRLRKRKVAIREVQFRGP